MRRLDAVVVGAGPAGSTAARLLAEQGARVMLLEARRLPRPKLCGGGLTPKAQRLIPPSALATVERWVERVELRGPRVPPIRLWEPAARIAMVERSRFDNALVEAASSAGAEIRDRERVREIVEDPLGAWIVTDRERLRADAVVLADSEPSTLSRRLGLGGQARRLSLALEVDLPFAPDWPSDTSVLSFERGPPSECSAAHCVARIPRSAADRHGRSRRSPARLSLLTRLSEGGTGIFQRPEPEPPTTSERYVRGLAWTACSSRR